MVAEESGSGGGTDGHVGNQQVDSEFTILFETFPISGFIVCCTVTPYLCVRVLGFMVNFTDLCISNGLPNHPTPPNTLVLSYRIRWHAPRQQCN